MDDPFLVERNEEGRVHKIATVYHCLHAAVEGSGAESALTIPPESRPLDGLSRVTAEPGRDTRQKWEDSD